MYYFNETLSNVMAVRVPVSDLGCVLTMLKSHLPDSMAVYFPVMLVSRGLSGYDVCVDRLPTITAVLVMPNDSAYKCSDHEKSTFIYTVPEANPRALLYWSGLLEYDHITFTVVWKAIYDKLINILSQEDCSLYSEIVSSGNAVYYTDNVPDVPTLPAGFHCRPLVPGDHESVISGVEYKQADYVKSVRRILAVGTLSVGLVNETSGELVAWSLQQLYGYLGTTFVRPEYRNKGLGKYVTANLTRQMIEKDGICMAAIGGQNSVSLNMHLKLGFKRMKQLFYTGLFRAKNATSCSDIAIMKCS